MPVQAKLKIGQPNDKYEQEADRVADQIMRMPEPDTSNVKGEISNVKSNKNILLRQPEQSCPECNEDDEKIQTKPISDQITPLVQRQVAEEEEAVPDEGLPEEEEKFIQTKILPGKSPEVTPGLSREIVSLRDSGRLLSKSERIYFEPRFGTDFSRVRIHTDSHAAKSAESINARAFTRGSDVVFGAGLYSPESCDGRRLLAHELVHTIQQQRYPHPPDLQRKPSPGRDLESPRFKGDVLLENILDGEAEMGIGENDRGPSVRKVQKGLIDAGYPLPKYGADGIFGAETKETVILFQLSSGHRFGIYRDKGLADGVVRSLTMLRLDQMYPPGARTAGTPPPDKKDFQIHGKWEGFISGLPMYRYFFDFDSAELDEEEQSKVYALAPPGKGGGMLIEKDDPVDMFGYASEEGADWYNLKLADRRAKKVAELWRKAGHFSDRTPIAKPKEGLGKIDYRWWRAVQVVPKGQKNGGAAPPPIVTCPVPPTKINNALKKADEMISKALEAIKDPTKLSPDTIKALELFRGASAIPKLRPNLTKIRRHLKQKVHGRRQYVCATNSFSGCRQESMAVNEGCGPGAMMYMCPSLIKESDSEKAAYWLIHEGAHGAKGVCASDFARYFHRMIEIIEQEHALQNAESYALFVALVYRPGSKKVGPIVRDQLMGFKSENEKKQANHAMAFTEVWVDQAAGQTAHVYRNIKKARASRKWKISPYMYKMNLLAPRFGLTRPPRIPTKRDQWAVAAIHDRYNLMRKAITRDFGMSPIKIIRIHSANDRWFPDKRKPGDRVELGTGFFGQSNAYRRVLFLILKLVEATPDISPAFEPKYVEFADLNRQHNGFPSP